MVSSLIDPDTKWWKTEVLQSTFLPFEVETILKIPLSHNLPEDKLIWIGNKKAEFSVKSAYHIAHSMIDSTELGESSSGDPYRYLWRNLWQLNLPAKIKIFAWRACINGLPTFENISKRGINCYNACPICGQKPEDIMHALLHCVAASLAWSYWSDHPRPPQSHNWSFPDMALHLIQSNVTQVEALAMEKGILLTLELQLSQVILESDAIVVIQALNDNSTGSELCHILQGIQLARESFELCIFKCLNRVLNVVAHELAQLARRNESSCVWNGVTPPAVSMLVQNDLLYLA
ncbi:hypothetical protein SO802_009276 [Lithocarpus litseifolius]|uniref:Reverse transcriptase zinc-binding domain-containing protein n=1 Tax=Lithocarpus litseifolius TaxID=425828 RepID=A0AAW2DCC1_9ROSI